MFTLIDNNSFIQSDKLIPIRNLSAFLEKINRRVCGCCATYDGNGIYRCERVNTLSTMRISCRECRAFSPPCTWRYRISPRTCLRNHGSLSEKHVCYRNSHFDVLFVFTDSVESKKKYVDFPGFEFGVFTPRSTKPQKLLLHQKTEPS